MFHFRPGLDPLHGGTKKQPEQCRGAALKGVCVLIELGLQGEIKAADASPRDQRLNQASAGGISKQMGVGIAALCGSSRSEPAGQRCLVLEGNNYVEITMASRVEDV